MSNAGAGFVQGVKSGNQIRPKGQKTRQRGAEVEELTSLILNQVSWIVILS